MGLESAAAVFGMTTEARVPMTVMVVASIGMNVSVGKQAGQSARRVVFAQARRWVVCMVSFLCGAGSEGGPVCANLI